MSENEGRTMALAVGALGLVSGNIGTSPTDFLHLPPCRVVEIGAKTEP